MGAGVFIEFGIGAVLKIPAGSRAILGPSEGGRGAAFVVDCKTRGFGARRRFANGEADAVLHAQHSACHTWSGEVVFRGISISIEGLAFGFEDEELNAAKVAACHVSNDKGDIACAVIDEGVVKLEGVP